MKTFTIEREQWLPRPLNDVFTFFSRPENLQEITPPWLDFRVLEAPQVPFPGALIRYRLRWHGIPLRWTSQITEWNPPHRFIDRAISGPYAVWNHEHSFLTRKRHAGARPRAICAAAWLVWSRGSQASREP